MISNQRGVVSLLTSIFISLLVLIVATAMVAVALREQRQSTDNDQSVRAYFAAQAGVEDALLKVKQQLVQDGVVDSVGETVCPAPISLGNSVEITCQRILASVNALERSLNIDEPANFDIGAGGKIFNEMDISWHQYCTGCPAQSFVGTPDYNSTGFPAGNDNPDRWQLPAALEITAIDYGSTAVNTPGNIGITTIVLRPNSAGGLYPATVPITAGLRMVRCHTTASGPIVPSRYWCRARLSGFNPSRFYVLRMRPRYRGTQYSVSFFNAGSVVTGIPDEYVTIDVTAKAGSVFRRIVSKLPVRGGVPGALDYVLYSETDICKNPTIDLATEQLSSGSAGPSC